MKPTHPSILLSLCVVGSLAGCGQSSRGSAAPGVDASASSAAPLAPAPSASASAAASGAPPVAVAAIPPTGPMTSNYEGKVVALPHGIATLGDVGLELVFTDVASTGCNHNNSKGTTASFTVPAGPKTAYFAGATFGAPVHVYADHHLKDDLALQTSANRITFQAFKPAMGEHVRGTLQATGLSGKKQTQMMEHDDRAYGYSVGGTFDVVICEDTRAKPALVPPSAPTTGSFHGTVGTTAFVTKTALATSWHYDNSGLDQLRTIELYPDANVTCATRNKATASISFYVHGGATSAWAPLGTVQPATTEHGTFPAASGPLSQDAWVSFDSIAWKAGASVTGTAGVVGTDKDPTKAVVLGGHFSATVCAEGSL